MHYIEQWPDGRLVEQDKANNRHRFLNRTKHQLTFLTIDEWFSWILKNQEEIPWIPNSTKQHSYGH